MVLVFLVFFVFAIISHFAKTEQLDCPVHEISTDTRQVYFGETQVYAIRVCVTMKWPIKSCKKKSHIQLTLSGGMSTSTSTSFVAADVNGRFCYIFDPCYIAKWITSSWPKKIDTISATASVYAFDKGPNPKSASLDIQIADTYYDTSKKEDNHELDHEILSVICRFPNCTVQSEGKEGDNKYYFETTRNGKSPKCIEKDTKTEATTFSITTFLCDPKCSRKYSMLESPIDAPPGPEPLPVPPPPSTPTGDTTTKGRAPATKAPRAPRAPAATTEKSNAVPHLSIGMIFTVAVLGLLA